MAPAPVSFSVNEDEDGHSIYAFSDNEAHKVGRSTLSKTDADKLLKGSGASYDPERGVYDSVPESVVKTLSSGRPSMLAELKARFGAGEAELHRSSLFDAALTGEMTFEEARNRSNPDLVQAQLAHYPGSAWHGLGDAINRFAENPVDEGGEILRSSIAKTAEALPSIMKVAKNAAVGGAIGAGVGLAVPIPGAAAIGAGIGTFRSLLHMEAGGMAADMHDRGFQESTIKKVAPIAGAVKAGFWMYGVDAMAMPFKGLFLKGLAESEPARKMMASWAYNYAMNAGIKMPAIGAAQSAVTDMMNNIAAMVDKRPDLMRTSADFSKNAVQSAIDMAEISTVAGIPGAAIEGMKARELHVQDAALAKEVGAKLAGVERLEPAATPSPLTLSESPAGEKTSGPTAQTTSSESPSGTPQAPLETSAQPSVWAKETLHPSITEHPAFVKALEAAKKDLPPGVDPTDRQGVVDAYTQAAKEVHDFKNRIQVMQMKGEMGLSNLSVDEKNQVMAQGDQLMWKMANLRNLALFMRDPEKAAAYEDWVAGGHEGESPGEPIDPHNEAYRKPEVPAEQKLNETLDNKEAKPNEAVQALDAALREDEAKRKAAPKTLEEKTRNVEAEGRIQALTSDSERIQQRIGELASTRDRMEKNGLSTGAIDRQINKLFEQQNETTRDIAFYTEKGKSAIVEPNEKLEMRPATLEDIVNIGFKEGGKQSQARARELLAIAKENGLTATDVKKLVGNKAIGAMGDAAYKNFVEGFEREGKEGEEPQRVPGFKEGVAKLVEHKKARTELAAVIKDRQIEKEQYVRQLNKLPVFSKMTTEQLKSYADILRGYDKADTALSPKRVAALKGTVLEGVKTEGETREKAAQLTGQPVKDFQNVRVPLKARAIPDPHLRAWYPALRPFVDLSGEMSEKGERLAEVVKERNNELATAAIRERRAQMGTGAKLADWFAPQQREVMAYLEAKEPDKVAAAAAKLTPAELKWGDFLKSWFGTAEDYLIKKEGMKSRFSGAYAPHVNRGWPEILRDVKEQGLWSSLKEFAPQANRKTGDFVDANGNVLGFNKFFKQSMFRTGELEPSKNVVSAANRYVEDFYRKAALDQIAPVLDTLAKAMKPQEDFNPKEMQAMTSSLEDFVRAYVNNKKGINNSAGTIGELLAPALRLTRTLASIHWIAGNYALQIIKGAVAIPTGEFMVQGLGLANAERLRWTDQGQKVIEKYRSFTGKGPVDAFLKEPGKDVSDFANVVAFGGFAYAHKASLERLLLGSMTEKELAAGEISDVRLNEIRQKAGRWMDLHNSDSIMGSSEVGKTFSQYKDWAIPPVLSLSEDATALLKAVKSGGKERLTPVQVNEVLRLSALGAVAATVGTLTSKDMEDDTFTGQSIHYLRRAVGSMWHGIDPAFFFSAAGPGYVAKLANDLSLLYHMEEDKNGELKGVKALKKDLTPRVVKDIGKLVGGE